MIKGWRGGVVLLPLFVLACVSLDVHLDRRASRWGLEREIVVGAGFDHLAYRQGGTWVGRELHVYLEGDGHPWLDETSVSPDPTPRRPLALELMRLDPVDSVYLGRPCYHGLGGERSCTPDLWTGRRYGTAVVDSMEEAIRQLLGQESSVALVLVGYSGGGVLAVLLAERLEMIRAVITVAADLDVDAWADLHGYSRLEGSANPGDRAPLPASLVQIHLAGGRDANVPVSIVESFAERQPEAELLLFPDFDHACCWARVWPTVLDTLAVRLAVAQTEAANSVSDDLPADPAPGYALGSSKAKELNR